MNQVTGIGVGFRIDLAAELLERRPPEVKWLEVHPENYMLRGGRFPAVLAEASSHWPLVTHGLTMCYGSIEPFEREYLGALRDLLADVSTPWHSDHLCFGGVDGTFLHDLLPLPFDEEAAKLCAARFCEARDALDVELAFENVSYYAPCGVPATEVDFCLDVLVRTGGKMLLDVNNVYVNATNHGFDPKSFIDKIPSDRVVEIHVAGHLLRRDGLRIDTHGEPICEDVYALLAYTLEQMGPKPVLLERDNNIPKLDDILEEVRRLTSLYEKSIAKFQAQAATRAEVAP